MKNNFRLRLPPLGFWIASVLLGLGSYLFIEIIYAGEEWFAGRVAKFDPSQIVISTFPNHWPSLFLWIVVVLTLLHVTRQGAENWRQRGELLRRIFDTAVDGITIVDGQGRLTMMNAAAEKMLKVTQQEATQHFESPTAHRLFSAQSQLLAGVMQTRQPVRDVEQTLTRLEGTRVIFSISAAPLLDGTFEPTGAVATLRDITEQKQAEEALAQERNTLRTLIDSLPDYVYIKDTQSRVIITNPANARVMRASSPEAAIGKTDFDFFPYDEAARYFAAEQEIVRSGQALVNNEEIGRDPAGNKRWTLTTKVPLRDSQGQIVGLVGIGRDITERKRTEDALIRERNLLHALIDNLPDLIYVKDAESRFLIVNQAEVRLLGGKSPEDLLGKSDLDFFPKKLAEIYISDEQALLASCEPMLNHEEPTIDPAGNMRWLLTSKVPFRNSDGSIAGLVGMGRDITERKRTEEALRQSVATNRALLDAMPDTMLRLAGDGRIVNFKAGHATDADLFTGDVIGKQIQAILPPEIADQMLQRVERALQTNQMQLLEYQLAGETITHDYEARLVVSSENEVIAILRDITDRKSADRMKNEFISTVSHELRTPLTSIRGSLGLIAGGVTGEISDQAKMLVDIAHKNSERLVRLINDILDIEKIESGKMVFDLKPLELVPLIDQALEANRSYGEQFGVELVLDPAPPGLIVAGDSDRLTQVLTNLLSNAAKFSPRGKAVTVSVSHRYGTVRVAVRDCGSGIPERFRSRIFQKFAQADSSDTRQKGGTGLGLSICKAIIEKHGGQIGFESEIGAGTTFYFDLPEWHAEPLETTAPSPKPRILVCEDDADIATLLRMMLEEGGFAVDMALNAAQAKQMLADNVYSGMTLDLILPDQDGISLIRELREQERTRALPIVVVSVRAREGRVELNGDAFRVIDWIDKPIDQQRLTTAIRQALAPVLDRKLRILHVEDDPDVLQIVSTLLHETAEVDGTTNIADVKQRIQQQAYDLVILDLALPDGYGLELIPLLRNQNPPIPVVIFSAHDVRKETAESVAATLVKSTTSNAKLLATIKSLLPAARSAGQ